MSEPIYMEGLYDMSFINFPARFLVATLILMVLSVYSDPAFAGQEASGQNDTSTIMSPGNLINAINELRAEKSESETGKKKLEQVRQSLFNLSWLSRKKTSKNMTRPQ